MKRKLLASCLIVSIPILLLSACIPLTKVQKKYTLGLNLKPNEKVALLWEHEDQYPLSEDLTNLVRPYFSERNIQLINFDSRSIKKELYGSEFIKPTSIPFEQLEELGVDYVLKIRISTLNEASWANYENAVPGDMVPMTEPTESRLITDIISTKEEKSFLQLESRSGYLLIAFEDEDGQGEWTFGNGSINTTFLRALRKTVKTLLKEYYEFN